MKAEIPALWPTLPYEEWKDTYVTLQRWIQIAGKVRAGMSPWVNHSWSTTFGLSSRGLLTPLISDGSRGFTIEFDFVNHCVHFQSTDGRAIAIELLPESVASFYRRFIQALDNLGIDPKFRPIPDETPDQIPFAEDEIHRTYRPQQAHRFWRVLTCVEPIFQEFRSQFLGKCSPVHFFWGSMDLVVTRFSGRRAPEHPGGVPHLADNIVKEAYSHEVSSCGFWPGGELLPEPVFYSYAYPQPQGFEKATVLPQQAYFHERLREFVLPYHFVQSSLRPRSALLEFLQSTYEMAADLAQWDRLLLEESPFLKILQDKHKRREPMAIHFRRNDPARAKKFFEDKMSFTTGPVEVDYYMKEGDDFNFIDVRAAEDYEEEHAVKATNLPEDQWNTFQGLSHDKLNILYCYSHVCHLAAKAAVKFAAAGFPVMEMDGGFKAWKDHELPTEKGPRIVKAAS